MKINHALTYIIAFVIAAVLSSCEVDRIIEDKPRNLYGDAGRTSNYEDYGEFYSRMKITYDLEGEDTTGAIQPPLVVRSYQIAAATSGGSIVLLNNSGTLWTFKLGEDELVASAMCADPNENIYALTNMGNLYKLDIDGNLIWKKNIYENEDFSRIFSDLLATREAVYAADRDGVITKIDTSGKIDWIREFTSEITETFAADAEGNIVTGLTSGDFSAVDTLAVLSPEGEMLMAQAFSGRIINTPVVAGGKIFLAVEKYIGGSRLSKIYCIDAAGKTVWDIELSVMPRYISVDSEGNSYAVGYNAGLGRPLSGMFAIDTTGKLKWHMYLKATVPAPAIITETQLIITATTDDGPTVSFFKRKEGVMIKQISLSDAPALHLMPAAAPDKTTIFLSTTEFNLLTIDDTEINKILPY
jgi:outer membrane protein assembly factor BamB